MLFRELAEASAGEIVGGDAVENEGTSEQSGGRER
jgi:hypothetical protein